MYVKKGLERACCWQNSHYDFRNVCLHVDAQQLKDVIKKNFVIQKLVSKCELSALVSIILIMEKQLDIWDRLPPEPWLTPSPILIVLHLLPNHICSYRAGVLSSPCCSHLIVRVVWAKASCKGRPVASCSLAFTYSGLHLSASIRTRVPCLASRSKRNLACPINLQQCA